MKGRVPRRLHHRGVSSVVGTLVFVAISIAVFSLLGLVVSQQVSLNQNSIRAQQVVSDRMSESLSVQALPNGVLVTNDGSIASEVVGLLVLDETTGRVTYMPESGSTSPLGSLIIPYVMQGGTQVGVVTSLGDTYWASASPTAADGGANVDFEMAETPNSATGPGGVMDTVNVTLTSLNGYDCSVTLSSSNVPPGVTIGYSDSSVVPSSSGTSSTMSVSVSSSAQAGTYTIVVMGAGIDGTVHATTFTLTVLARSGTGLTGFFSGLRRTATYTGIRY